MGWLQRAVNAVRGAERPAPRIGRLADAEAWYHSELFSGDFRAERIRGLYAAAQYGDGHALATAYRTLLIRDPLIASESSLREQSLSLLPWEIVTAEEAGQVGGDASVPAAERSRDYCREALRSVPSIEQALSHLAGAVSRGLAVCELVWAVRARRHELVDVVPIEFDRLAGDSRDVRRVRVRTAEQAGGVLIDETPANFLAHRIRRVGDTGWLDGLLLPSLLLHLLRTTNLRAWAQAAELFGAPFRVVRFASGTTAGEIDEMKRMLAEMGACGFGLVPEGNNIELHQRSVGGELIYTRLADQVNQDLTRLWRGATLTAAVGETGGAFAAAAVHDKVRADLRDADRQAEAETLRRQLLATLVHVEFGPDAPVPVFRRVIESPRDMAVEGSNLSRAVNELGLRIPQSFAAQLLGVPLAEPADADEPIPGRPAASPLAALPQREPPSPPPPRVRRRLAVRENSLIDAIAAGRSPLAAIADWMRAAAQASVTRGLALAEQVAAALEPVDEADPAVTAVRAAAAIGAAMPAEADGDLAEVTRQSLLAATLHGRWTARQRIGGVVAAAERIDFARLPFAQAIENLRARLNLDPETFLSLDARARSRAFRVAKVYELDLVRDIHAALVRQIESGGTARDFRLALRQAGQLGRPIDETGRTLEDLGGWLGERPWRADVVYSQQVAMSHAAGRYEQYGEAGVERWRFTSFGDSCPICQPEVGQVYRLADTSRMPPLHFGCDCMDEPVFEGEATEAEPTDSAAFPNPALVAEQARAGGFKWRVEEYAALGPVSVGRWPEWLHDAVRAAAAQYGWEVIA